MTPRLATTLPRWTLRHSWHGDGDSAALALCRAALRDVGIALTDVQPNETPSAIKFHGMETVDALAIDSDALLDLRAVAQAAQWPRRLPPFVQKFMRHGERWHGIPLGVHRANAAWVNAACARRIGGGAPRHMPAFLAWLEHARGRIAAPLAVGAEPWQIGVLFESVMLAVAGATVYRRAFVEQDPAVWAEPAASEAVACFLRLRDFVADDALALSWQDQLARVRCGEAAVQVMGDWVRATDGAGLVEWVVPGTAAWFVAIVDFFVPLAGASATLSNPVAEALTAAPFQYAFAVAKGCLPAVQDAWGVIDPQRTRGVDVEAMVLPSLTFDQCCGVAHKQPLLAIVASCFVERRSASVCTLALADLAHGMA